MTDPTPYTTEHEKSFRNKNEHIEKRYQEFWDTPNAGAVVVDYWNDIPNPGYASDSTVKWVERHPKFRDPKDSDFAEGSSQKLVVIGNSSSFDVIQHRDRPGRASMSMIHLLAIPTARIFNGVSLNHESVDILVDMIQFFKQEWGCEEQFRLRIVEYQEQAIRQDENDQLKALEADEEGYEKKCAAIKDASETALEHYRELKPKALELSEEDFHFGLHLCPDHSVNHLHMHIIAAPQELRQYSTSENDWKTVDAMELHSFIKGLFPNHPSNQIKLRQARANAEHE